jgi:hypothetical protein
VLWRLLSQARVGAAGDRRVDRCGCSACSARDLRRLILCGGAADTAHSSVALRSARVRRRQLSARLNDVVRDVRECRLSSSACRADGSCVNNEVVEPLTPRS